MTSLISLLTRPAVLYTVITALGGSLVPMMMKAYSQRIEISQLKDTLLSTQQALTRAQTNLAVLQSDLSRQEQEISRYNSLASRYEKELESKYSTPPPTSQPCSFDFSLANSLLTRQGAKP